uniref:Uncharacterized protein n=1 Tax=Anopheles culicifacies TaxID=139723 RepID=A0A182MRE8_9DIPT
MAVSFLVVSLMLPARKVASIGANTLNFTDLGSPYEGPPSTPQSGMDAPDAPHTPKYIDGGATATAPGKSAFVELQQHGLVLEQEIERVTIIRLWNYLSSIIPIERKKTWCKLSVVGNFHLS